MRFATVSKWAAFAGVLNATLCHQASAQSNDLSGNWAGSYADSFSAESVSDPENRCTWNQGGNISLTLTIDGSAVSGSFVLDGIQCLDFSDCSPFDTESASGSIFGTVESNSVSLTLNGTLLSGVCEGQSIGFAVNGTFDGTSITGTIDEDLSSTVTAFSGISDSITLVGEWHLVKAQQIRISSGNCDN